MQQDNPTTIQATVNTRLLSKAQRLFTGTLQGRIIELLQNARRAGATEVIIKNNDGRITVADNGKGISDFSELLDLGGSGWNPRKDIECEDTDASQADLEQSEDPAGVGLFCLAPRKLIVQSRGCQAVIEGRGWHGDAVQVVPAETPAQGSTFIFTDEPWSFDSVEPFATYTGMRVVVDDKPCRQLNFIEGRSRDYPELGIRIKVVPIDQLPPFCYSDGTRRFSRDQVYVNFFGQVVSLDHQPVDRHQLAYLVELTGMPTGIRLMLPARTRLIENQALAKLKEVIEWEAYDHLRLAGQHKLAYSQFIRARELGVSLPEATPDYEVGLLSEDGFGLFPVEVHQPDGMDLSRCYRMDASLDDEAMSQTANAHLLAAFSPTELSFIPVTIHERYNGYAWADLPRITGVTVVPGKTLFEEWVGSYNLNCVDSLHIEVKTADGRSVRHAVPMAVRPDDADANDQVYQEEELYLTPAARNLRDEEIWYHMGGFCDDGDTWDTQLYEFGKELAAFWDQLDGPLESVRRRFVEATWNLPKGWQSVMTLADGTMQIRMEDGKTQTVNPPKGGAL
ncbi:MAG: ATP-binding protein [Phycisphaeraceae bacterium]